MAVIDSLIASWDLAEATGDAVDSHSNGYDLTETGGTIASGSGPAGTANTARDFEDANGDDFRIADASAPNLSMGSTDDFSIAFFAKLERNDINLSAVTKSDNNNIHEYEVRYSDSGAWHFKVASGAAYANFTTAVSDAAFTTGQWYFIVARHDAVNDTIDIGIDGDTTPSSTAYTHGCWDGTAPFYLGQSGNNSVYFDGMLAQVRIWRKVLSTAEVTWLYNAGAGRTYAEIVAAGGGGGGSNPARIIIQKA